MKGCSRAWSTSSFVRIRWMSMPWSRMAFVSVRYLSMSFRVYRVPPPQRNSSVGTYMAMNCRPPPLAMIRSASSIRSLDHRCLPCRYNSEMVSQWQSQRNMGNPPWCTGCAFFSIIAHAARDGETERGRPAGRPLWVCVSTFLAGSMGSPRQFICACRPGGFLPCLPGSSRIPGHGPRRAGVQPCFRPGRGCRS